MNKDGLRRIFEVNMDKDRLNPLVLWQVDLEKLELIRFFLAYMLGREDKTSGERLKALKAEVDEMISECYMNMGFKGVGE